MADQEKKEKEFVFKNIKDGLPNFTTVGSFWESSDLVVLKTNKFGRRMAGHVYRLKQDVENFALKGKKGDVFFTDHEDAKVTGVVAWAYFN